MVNSRLWRFFEKLAGKQLVEAIKEAQQTSKQTDERTNITHKRSQSWHHPGDIVEVIPHDHGLRLICQHATISLDWITTDCLHIRLAATHPELHTIAAFPYAIAKQTWPPTSFNLTLHEQFVEMMTKDARCVIQKTPLHISLQTPDGKILCHDAGGMRFRQDGKLSLGLTLQPDETSYGLGGRSSEINLRGRKWILWNTDPPEFERGSDPLYYSIPFYLGVHSQGAYGVFWDNSCRGEVDLGASDSHQIIFTAEGGELQYYLFAGPSVRRVLSCYTELTGRIALPPLWALGYHQSRFSYDTQECVLKLAEGFRARGIPCDALYLDIHYLDGYRVFTWDAVRFPQPSVMFNKLRELGFHTVAIINPGVRIDPNYPVYLDGIKNNVFLRQPDGEPVAAATWPGLCHFPDFTGPNTRAWWARCLKDLFDQGLDGIWNDMCEPTVFMPDGAGTLPDEAQHVGDGNHGNHVTYHNVYGMLMGRACWEAQRQYRPERRPVNMIRAGYAGAQRYASSWTGDNSSTWDHLRLSISMVLNMGLSGAPITGPDVGGFLNDADAELFTRWLQAASLMPFCRSHTALDTADQEPWSFGSPYETINRDTIMLRYHLLPYLYAAVAQAREYGWPIVRPLFMADEGNPALRLIDDCYLLGDVLLAAPVLEAGAVRRSVTLPAGVWYDFWTNEALNGGQLIETEAPLERLPLFVKAGAVLPLWPSMDYTLQRPIDELLYRVYPGDFENILYEDRGEGLEYEQGDYRWVYITCEQQDGHLFINRRTAGRYVPDYRHIRVEVVGLKRQPVQIRIDRQSAPVWFYDEGLLEMKIDSFQQIHIISESAPSDETLLRRPW